MDGLQDRSSRPRRLRHPTSTELIVLVETLRRERWTGARIAQQTCISRATVSRIRQAKFPVTKSLDSFDFLAMPTLNKAMVLELARCEFLMRRENVLLLGNGGPAQTQLAGDPPAVPAQPTKSQNLFYQGG